MIKKCSVFLSEIKVLEESFNLNKNPDLWLENLRNENYTKKDDEEFMILSRKFKRQLITPLRMKLYFIKHLPTL
jgi:hypothetical protein